MVRTGQKYTVRKRLLMVSAIFNDCLDIHVVLLFTYTMYKKNVHVVPGTLVYIYNVQKKCTCSTLV